MPKVSVVMAVFNGEKYIGEAIDSVLKQSMRDLELIVVNDGSTDNTLQVVQTYASDDARVKLINRPNSGRPSFPRNDAIAAASGEYICFLDHDDLYDVDRIGQLADGLDNHSDWVAAFHDMRYINSEGKDLSYQYLKDYGFLQNASIYLTPLSDDWFECNELFYVYQSLKTGALHTATVMVAINRLPKDTVKFDTQFSICDDTDLWIRIGLQGKMGYLNRVLSSYRQHQTSITQNLAKFQLDTVLLHKVNYQRVKNLLKNEQANQLRMRIAGCLGEIAYYRYMQYHLKDARTAYWEALSWHLQPILILAYLKTFIPESILRRLKDYGKKD